MPDPRDLDDLARPASVHESVRTRIAAWLQDGPAQQRDGEHIGAVAGFLMAGGSAGYVYPEITGYYLQWLAGRARAGDDVAALAPRAQAAQEWLQAWAAADEPATRVYLTPATDWRNGGRFLFDIAMVLRGLASATSAGLLVPDAALVARVASLALDLRETDGTLAAARAHAGREPLPDRWSTRPGPFLAKAAAGLLDAGMLPGAPDALRDAAARTLTAALAATLAAQHDETHPALYAMEGLLARHADGQVRAAYPALAAQLEAVLRAAAALGRLPESVGHPGQARLDILAQALRAGCLLRALGVRGAPARETLDRLAATLASRVTPGGGVPFSTATTPPQLNVWTSMFAEQALAWHGMGAAFRRDAETPWIV